jgi:hypothetical protein
MILKDKAILSDDSLGGPPPDKINLFRRRKPNEYS